MEAKAKWLTEDGNIIAPNTLDSCVFGSDGKSLEEKLPFEFGIDGNGKYGYYKTNEETITPFGTGDGGLAIPDMSYSTEEQLTNMRWIDGKPIYQKTIFIENPTNGGYYEHNLPIEKCIIRDVTALRNGKWQTGIYKDFSVWVSDTQCYTIWDTNTIWDTDTISNIYITILYTKTTDTSSSPVALPKVEALHVYSTEEKVVGTWIDGKPLYERTITGINMTYNASDWVLMTYLPFNDIDILTSCFGLDEYNQRFNPVGVLHNKSDNGIYWKTPGGNMYWNKIVTMTIQYTKTTDTPTI